MVAKLWRLAVLTVPVIAVSLCVRLPSAGVSAQQSVNAERRVDQGLSATTFDTPKGKITVNLPDDMAASDTISGTVMAEPAGETAEEKAKNEDEISGYVIEVAKAEEKPQTAVVPKKKKPPVASTKAPDFTCLIPIATETIRLVLKDPTGKRVCESEVPCLPTPPAMPCAPTECIMPRVGSCGRPIEIKGPCDGSFANTNVQIGGQPAKPLAESPRKQVVKTPKSVVGPTQIERREGTQVTKAKFNNLRVKLVAQKVGLRKGEQTTLTVKVEGLQGLEGPVQLRIENRTPDVVQLSGGDKQTITINPSS